MKASTRALFRQAGSLLGGVHAYIYARWTIPYLNFLTSLPSGGKPSRAGSWFANRWHAKVLPLEHAQSIIRLDHRIERRDLGEQVIPYPLARDLVLDGPPDVVVYECPCRLRLPQHCEPTQVCMVIGKPATDFMLDHHPTGVRRLSQSEALELLQAEHERGHVHCAWFKESLGGRMYAICNCCKCCCAGLQTMLRGGSPMVASSGYTATLSEADCIVCGDCVTLCPFEAISCDGAVHIDGKRCMGCGVCAIRCPSSAIALERDASKPLPLDVRALS